MSDLDTGERDIVPEIKKIVPLLGSPTEVVDVPILTAQEHFNEYELEDGSFVRVKCVATAFLRVEGQFMPDGSPIYVVYTSPSVSVKRFREPDKE